MLCWIEYILRINTYWKLQIQGFQVNNKAGMNLNTLTFWFWVNNIDEKEERNKKDEWQDEE